MDAVVIEQVWTYFGERLIHRDINLRLAKGEILGIVGASGCGKTTLLREVIGLQIPQQGKITVMGKDITTLTDSKILLTLCGFLFQKGALFSSLDVFENIAFPLRELGIHPENFIKHLVFNKLTAVGLQLPDAWLKPANLSGGMIKRVALARSLILEPSLLLLDEPTAGLDPIASQEFGELLIQLHQELNFTVMMVTHDLDVLLDICTRIAVLANQELVAYGTLSEVLACSHPFVQEFFHNPRAQRVFQHSITSKSPHGSH